MCGTSWCSLGTHTLLAPASGASNGLRISQDFGKVVYSCSTPIYNGYYITNFWVPNVPLYILTHNVELTTLIHKIIVSIVASAHELRNDHIKVFQSVGTTLLNSSILSRLIFPVNVKPYTSTKIILFLWPSKMDCWAIDPEK